MCKLVDVIEAVSTTLIFIIVMYFFAVTFGERKYTLLSPWEYEDELGVLMRRGENQRNAFVHIMAEMKFLQGLLAVTLVFLCAIFLLAGRTTVFGRPKQKQEATDQATAARTEANESE